MPIPGASNVNFGAGLRRGSFNVSNAPGGSMVPYKSPANPNYQPPPFADPPKPAPKLAPPPTPPSTPQPLPPLQPKPPAATPSPLKLTPPSGGGAAVAVGAGGVATGAFTAGNLGTLAALIWASNFVQLYKLWQLSQPEPEFKPQEEPGQGDGIPYLVSYTITINNQEINQSDIVYGSVLEIRYNNRSSSDSGVEILCRGRLADRKPILETPQWVQVNYSSAGPQNATVRITSIQQLDQQGNPVPQQPQQPQQQRQPQQPTPQQIAAPSPLPRFAEPEPPGKFNVAPNLPPAPVNQPQQQNKKPYYLEFPSNAPFTISSPGAAPISVSPPSGSTPPAPGTPPAQIRYPTNTPSGQPQPVQVNYPGAQPTNLTFPSGAPITINFPGAEPIIFNPPGQGRPSGTTQPDLTQPRLFTPTQLPTTPLTPSQPGTPTSPTTPTKPDTPTQPYTPPSTPDLTTGAGLAAITLLLQQIQAQTSAPAIAAAVCNTAQPGGCVDNAVKRNTEPINNKLNQINAGLSGLDALQGLDTNLRVRNIEDKTGSLEYPMLLPEYMMEDSLDKQVTIANQAQFNAWLLKNISALVGIFPIKIDRENEDGTKQTLKLENLAETQAELIGILAKIAFDADTSVNVGIRSTAEGIGARIAALQAGSYLKAIVDYLGFQTQSEPFPVKISCTIGAVGTDGNLQESELDDFLKPSTQNVIGIECREQDDLHTIIKRILFDGEIARAALYKPLKPDKINNNLSITGDGIKEHRKKEEEKINKRWEEFKAKIENQTNLPFKIDIDEKGTDSTT